MATEILKKTETIKDEFSKEWNVFGNKRGSTSQISTRNEVQLGFGELAGQLRNVMS
jgi:hypothetical protein